MKEKSSNIFNGSSGRRDKFKATYLFVTINGHLSFNKVTSRITTGAFTWAICGFWFMYLEPRHPGSSVFRRLHKITPSRSVLAKSSIVDSDQWTLWSALKAPHLVSQFAQSRHPPFAMAAARRQGNEGKKNLSFLGEYCIFEEFKTYEETNGTRVSLLNRSGSTKTIDYGLRSTNNLLRFECLLLFWLGFSCSGQLIAADMTT